MYDLIIRNGTVIDGLGGPPFTADIGVVDGTITAIGELGSPTAREVIDATDKIVAPGVIDLHTHYDAQIHWDPHCSNSGTHGITTVVIGNCGFGFAPCRSGMGVRYMRMMERSEQIPLEAMEMGMEWRWETFPEWLDDLRGIPKAVHVAALFPMNAAMLYVMGEDAKHRPATEDERARLRELLDEAMEAGAVGFGFTRRGEHNMHTDVDGTPMPTDVMQEDEAYNLADVLRARGHGVIQPSTGVGEEWTYGKEICTELARRSGRPVLHNAVLLAKGSDSHEAILEWLDECEAEDIPVYSQGFLHRTFTQFDVENYTSWDGIDVFKDFTNADHETRLAMASSSDYRDRVRREYDFDPLQHGGTKFHEFTVLDAGGSTDHEQWVGKTISEIAKAIGTDVTDTFYDVLVASELRARFTHLSRFVTDAEVAGPVVAHPRVIAGGSDGGAHVRYVSSGHWPTDLLVWLSRDNDQVPLPEMHRKLSKQPADLLGLTDRGSLEVGKIADLYVYDLEEMGFRYGSYDIVDDLPDGSWRCFVTNEGISHVVVRGEITIAGGKKTDARPGELASPVGTAASVTGE